MGFEMTRFIGRALIGIHEGKHGIASLALCAGAGQQTSINVAAGPKGILIMRVQGADNGTTAVFKLLKQ